MGSIPNRTSAAVSFDSIPGSLPQGSVPDNVDVKAAKQIALANLNDLQKQSFAADVIWRDALALTDTLRTLNSVDIVVDTLQQLGREKRRSLFKLMDREPRVTKVGDSSWLDIDIHFTIQDDRLVGCCDGIVSVLQNNEGQWKIWMLRTWLECWGGHGHPDHPEHARVEDHPTSIMDSNDTVYDVVVIGGGQAGLSVAGRLRALGVSHILFESHPSIGGQWATRYDSLRWHTTRDYSGLPFGYTFPETEEQMIPTKRIAAGHKAWSEKYGINARTSTKVIHTRYDEDSQIWTVATTSTESGKASNATWRARNVVLSIGSGAVTPILPSWAAPEAVQASGFTGTVVHSADYHNVAGFEGQRGIVVGVANTGHDVAEDMANAGMATTLIQRNPTFVLPAEWLQAAQDRDYHRRQPVARADRQLFTLPMKVTREVTNHGIHAAIRAHPERFDALERAGFRLDRFGDIKTNVYIRYGGHYVDTGASARIAAGEIKVRAAAVERLTPDGVRFADGTELAADLIVLATGFEHDFRKDAANVLGADVAARMDDFWGLDAEGEIRGNAKLAGHPHLYYFGGDTRLARFFSSYVALQIQKECLGVPLRPFTKYRA